MDDKGLLLVHIGAGYHSPKHDTAYTRLLKKSVECQLLQLAARAVERSWITNTGRGSNVDRSGYASLDATYLKVVNGKVANVLSLVDICDENPTKAITQAKNWLDTEFNTNSLSSKLGLLRPLSLVYSQLQGFLGLQTSLSSLIRPSTEKAYKRVKEYFDAKLLSEASDAKDAKLKRQRLSSDLKSSSGLTLSEEDILQEIKTAANLDPVDQSKIEDTIGVLEVSNTNDQYEIDAVTSSGGTFFKLPGRISCAGSFGAGLAFSHGNEIQVVGMCTGNGDDISRMNLASFLTDAIAANYQRIEKNSESIGEFLVSSIVQRSSMFQLSAVDTSGSPTIYLGAVAIIISKKRKSIVYCHSTESFYFAFRLNNEVEIVMSRKRKANGSFLHGEYQIQ